jgi:hypothetical protein
MGIHYRARRKWYDSAVHVNVRRNDTVVWSPSLCVGILFWEQTPVEEHSLHQSSEITIAAHGGAWMVPA